MKLSQPSGQQQQEDQSKAAAAAAPRCRFPRAQQRLTLPYKMVQPGKATGKVWDLLLGPLGDFCTNIQQPGVSHRSRFPYRRTSNKTIVCSGCYVPFSYNSHYNNAPEVQNPLENRDFTA